MLRFRNPDTLLYELLSALKEVVEDRLVKADVSKKGGKK
jgi:hypothetical protein